MKQTLEELELGLAIDQNALEDACRQQPELYYRVASELATAISQRDAALQWVKEAEANADVAVRQDAEKQLRKTTEAEVKNLVRLDKEVMEAHKECLDLSLEADKLTALKESFSQRQWMLRELVQLYLAGYYGDISESANSERIRNTQADIARKEMAIRRQTLEKKR